MSSPYQATALIAAAGRGRRFGSRESKAFAIVAGEPLLAHSLRAMEACDLVTATVPIVPPSEEARAREIARHAGCGKVTEAVAGGAHRQESVHRGLRALSPPPDIVVIHDGARPLVSPGIVAATIEAAVAVGAAVAAASVSDTVKRVGPDDVVEETLDRRELYAAQTPQTFRYELIMDAHERARADAVLATDDAALVERLGHDVRVVACGPENLKITTPQDLVLVEAMLEGRAGLRIGHGYDVHAFAPGRRLMLGGVEVPHGVGLAGHSDADVVAHAICDAMLGSVGAGDIGRHFPDAAPEYAGVSSLELAGRVVDIIGEGGWRVANVDATVVCEAPLLAPHIPLMRERLAGALGLSPDQVSVKATTTEGLGAVGRREGIACHAVALVRSVGRAAHRSESPPAR